MRNVQFLKTRWPSVNSLLDNYVQIREHLSKLPNAKLDDFLLHRRDEKQVDEAFSTTKSLNYIT